MLPGQVPGPESNFLGKGSHLLSLGPKLLGLFPAQESHGVSLSPHLLRPGLQFPGLFLDETPRIGCLPSGRLSLLKGKTP